MLVLLPSTKRAHALEINNRLLGSIAIIILVLYWLLLAIVPSPGFGAPRFDSVGSWPAVIDRAVFGLNHLFIYATTDGKVTYDPEGLLSTVPACVNAIVGVITAHWMIRNDSRGRRTVVFIVGIALMAAGTLLGLSFPIIKKIWTSSFVLLSSGFSLVTLAALDALLNRFELPRLMVAVRVFGTNALLAFALSFLLFPILDANAISRNGALISAQELLYSSLVTFIPDLYASFVYGAVITLLIFLMLVPLYRRRWFIRL
jgi:predicted acyltransferase